LFAQTSNTFTQNVNVIEQIGDGLVEAIEKGELMNSKLVDLLNSYIKPMLGQNLDILVLGCTHYTFLIPLLQIILPKNIQIIDSADAVAKQTFRVLKKEKLLSSKNLDKTVKYFSSSTKSTLSNFISEKIKVVNF
jgi:glutamate racemase